MEWQPKSRPGALEGDKLPAVLAAALDPHDQDALDHWVRRQILRVLHGEATPCSAREIAATIPGTNHGAVKYHADVLETLGSVRLAGDEPRVSFPRRYESCVSTDLAITGVLDAMRSRDEAGT